MPEFSFELPEGLTQSDVLNAFSTETITPKEYLQGLLSSGHIGKEEHDAIFDWCASKNWQVSINMMPTGFKEWADNLEYTISPTP